MKNKIISILKSIGIILLLLLFSSFFFGFARIDINNISNKTYIVYYTISNLILMGIFFLIYKDKLISDFKSFIKNFGNNMETSVRYWLVGLGIMYASNIFISLVLKKGIAGNEELVRSYVYTMPLLMIFNTSIYAPICEELAFRKSIRDAINNKWVYVLVSGLLFGFSHVVDSINDIGNLIYLIPYSALGISFALLYYKTDNIFSSIIVHFIHNTLAVLLIILLRSFI